MAHCYFFTDNSVLDFAWFGGLPEIGTPESRIRNIINRCIGGNAYEGQRGEGPAPAPAGQEKETPDHVSRLTPVTGEREGRMTL